MAGLTAEFYVFNIIALETKGTLITEYLANLDTDLVKVDTMANLLQMTSWDLTKEFKQMEGAPCEHALPSIEHTLTSGFTAMNK